MQKHSFRLFASLTCVALLVTPTLAQVNGPGPSAPSLFDTVVNLSGSTPPFGNDIGGVAGQTIQVNVNSGGIFGGASGSRRLLLLDGAELNVNGGTVDPDVRAQSGSEVNINSGSVGNSFVAEFGSVVNITGGTVDFSADAFGEVNISGGTVGRSFDARGGNVNISGGSVGYFFRANSSTELIGGEFRLNGAAFTGNSISLAEGDIFTGTLADGSSFIFKRPFGTKGRAIVDVSKWRRTAR